MLARAAVHVLARTAVQVLARTAVQVLARTAVQSRHALEGRLRIVARSHRRRLGRRGGRLDRAWRQPDACHDPLTVAPRGDPLRIGMQVLLAPRLGDGILARHRGDDIQTQSRSSSSDARARRGGAAGLATSGCGVHAGRVDRQ